MKSTSSAKGVGYQLNHVYNLEFGEAVYMSGSSASANWLAYTTCRIFHNDAPKVAL